MHADRRCEHCYRDWRGDPECPTCGHVALLPICAWHESELVTRMAVASGHAVTHGLCLDCARRLW